MVEELLHQLQRFVYYVRSFRDWLGLRNQISFGIFETVRIITLLLWSNHGQ